MQQNGRPCFIIAHPFSGRRRKEDFHRWLQHYSIEYDIDVCILSLDTAISPSAGDLHRSAASWHHLEQCYRAGIIAGSLLGTQCETFSEARFTPAPADCQRRWPRPLRSAEHLFGLPGLSIRELLQNIAGHWFRSAGIGSPLPPPSARWIGGVWAPRSTGWFRSTHFGGPDLPNCFSDILMSGRKRFVFMSGVLLQWSQQGYLVFRVPGLIGALRTAVIPHVRKHRSKRRSAASRGALHCHGSQDETRIVLYINSIQSSTPRSPPRQHSLGSAAGGVA